MKNFFRSLKIKRRIIALFYSLYIFRNPSSKMKVIGVTGTNGKTTTTTLLYEISKALGYKTGLIGTVENRIGEEKIFSTHTTPDTRQLYGLLKKMLKEGCEYVFIETSSHALHQRRTAGVNFTGGVFTNLTHDHLDYHKDFERYFSAKKKLFRKLQKDKFALSNIDDGNGKKILVGIKARRFTYGFEKPADFFGKIISMDFSGIELDINGERIKSKLLGRFNAYNLLAVFSVCKLLGFSNSQKNKERISLIFEKITPPAGRFEYFLSPSGVLVIVDYAHTPDALEKVIQTARGILSKGGKLITVFGCGGDRDPTKRPTMGRIGAEFSDIAVFTSDNPRSEDPEKIIEEMKTGLSEELLSKVMTFSNRREAIKNSVNVAKKGDIILCAGKGHEDYQEVRGVKNHFNDKEEYKMIYGL